MAHTDDVSPASLTNASPDGYTPSGVVVDDFTDPAASDRALVVVQSPAVRDFLRGFDNAALYSLGPAFPRQRAPAIAQSPTGRCSVTRFDGVPPNTPRQLGVDYDRYLAEAHRQIVAYQFINWGPSDDLPIPRGDSYRQAEARALRYQGTTIGPGSASRGGRSPPNLPRTPQSLSGTTNASSTKKKETDMDNPRYLVGDPEPGRFYISDGGSFVFRDKKEGKQYVREVKIYVDVAGGPGNLANFICDILNDQPKGFKP